MNKKARELQTTLNDASNEGILLPVKPVPGSQNQVSIDFTTAAAPQRRFTADGWRIDHVDDVFHLCFVQKKLSGDGIRAIVDVQLSDFSLGHFGQSLYELKLPDVATVEPVVFDAEPTQAVSFSATFGRVSASVGGGCLDFYFSSPFVMSGFNSSTQFRAIPEIRIVTGLRVFMSVISAIKAEKVKLGNFEALLGQFE